MDVHPRSLRADTTSSFLPSMQMSPESPVTPPSSSPITEVPSAPQKPAKRSFDVAFLMAPDDLTTKKRQQQVRLVSSTPVIQRISPPEMTFAHSTDAVELKISRTINQQRLFNGKGNVCEYQINPTSPLGLLIPSPKMEPVDLKYPVIDKSREEQSLRFAKSAFTKVKGGRNEYNGTPNKSVSPSSVSSTISGGGASPDISYQESLSPPMMNNNSRSPVQFHQSVKSLNPNMAYFASSGKSIPGLNPNQFFYPPKERIETKPTSPMNTNGFLGNFMTKSPADQMQKLRPMLYQNDTLPYGGLPVTAYPFPPNFPPSGAPVPTHTLLTAAAASVQAALLPPSFAAFSLPAQNVCAKCKISFRMTSDLVYHMRSHHKGEHVTVDAARRRRELDKLRCPVCNETFRERHHLTRHMTAHQDKEGDHDDEDDTTEINRRRSHLNK